MDFLLLTKQAALRLSEQQDLLGMTFSHRIEFEEHILFCSSKINVIEWANSSRKVILIGDPITDVQMHSALMTVDKTEKWALDNISGFYYLIVIEDSEVRISNSFFSILPIYYHVNSKDIWISSKASIIAKQLKCQVTPNRQFLFETILFNHPLGEDTAWQEIKLLPAHTTLIHQTSSGVRTHKYLDMTAMLVQSPKPWRKAITDLAELFLHESKKYMENDRLNISFTGGFDGRTLLACAQYHQSDLMTYSFGSKRNPDVTIPAYITKKYKIPYNSIYLDEPSYWKLFLDNGQEMIRLCDGNNSFLQVHFFQALKSAVGGGISLNGMFGSELLRALHVSGQVTASPLVDFFIQDTLDNWLVNIKNSYRTKYIIFDVFKEEWRRTVEFLDGYKVGLKGKGLNKNQQFYTFIFEETFRKFFGNLIIPQLKYATVRSPFIDYRFVTTLLGTELAGVHNEFYTHNPLKRYKGQMLYAYIIRQSHSPLLNEYNDKGYRPVDLLSKIGFINIMTGYIKKRIKRKILKPDLDALGIVSSFNYHSDFFNSISLGDGINKKQLKIDLEKTNFSSSMLQRDNLIRTLSVHWFFNEISNQKN